MEGRPVVQAEEMHDAKRKEMTLGATLSYDIVCTYSDSALSAIGTRLAG